MKDSKVENLKSSDSKIKASKTIEELMDHKHDPEYLKLLKEYENRFKKEENFVTSMVIHVFLNKKRVTFEGNVREQIIEDRFIIKTAYPGEEKDQYFTLYYQEEGQKEEEVFKWVKEWDYAMGWVLPSFKMILD